jgi:Fic family protein
LGEMKTPVPPPNLDDLLANVPRDRLYELIVKRDRPSVQDKYLPWDKLRYKTPPEGLTHEEWWITVRMGRDSMLRPLPFQAIDGSPFSYAMPDEVFRLMDEVTQRASGQILVPEPVTNPSTRDRYVVSSLIEEAITSSQLEGAVTSRRDAKRMLTSGTKPRNRSEQMILNNFYAMQHIVEIQDEEFTPEAICELHRIVTEDTLDDPKAAGAIQSNVKSEDRVKIFDQGDKVLHIPPPADQLEERLEALCDFANSGPESSPYVPPLVRALTIHFMAGYDHYFEDGNGRTARALFYWSMLKQGYWLTEYLTISRILKIAPAQYARSFMLTEQDSNDLTYFIIYQLNVLKRSLDDLSVYLERKVAELQATRSLLASTPGHFNHRQIVLLESATNDPTSEFTVRSHYKTHGVTPQTARNDLTDLHSRGFLIRNQIGKEFVFTPTPDLYEKLRDGGASRNGGRRGR